MVFKMSWFKCSSIVFVVVWQKLKWLVKEWLTFNLEAQDKIQTALVIWNHKRLHYFKRFLFWPSSDKRNYGRTIHTFTLFHSFAIMHAQVIWDFSYFSTVSLYHKRNDAWLLSYKSYELSKKLLKYLESAVSKLTAGKPNEILTKGQEKATIDSWLLCWICSNEKTTMTSDAHTMIYVY